MADDRGNKRIADSIHGEITLSPLEQRVVDTATFQRLRQLKQLGMAHLTFPGATHTRFSHSLGVLAIMNRVLQLAKDNCIRIDAETTENLRLAALLHDIGHYPYSHLLEHLDRVRIAERFVDDEPHPSTINLKENTYPGHEKLGAIIATGQQDLIDAIGGLDRAERVADLFSRSEAADPQFSKLIHSSLDMDRLDFLLRDAHACGVAFGQIDLHYLLSAFRISPEGMVGIAENALAAAEHFVLARYFMYQRVYVHKTTFGFEEACRQLLYRLREKGGYNIAEDGAAVKRIAKSAALHEFNDSYVDRLVHEAVGDEDEVIHALAGSIASRRPPRLLKQVSARYSNENEPSHLTAFRMNCRHRLAGLAVKHDAPLGLFLFAQSKPLEFEKRGRELTVEQVRSQPEEQADELIRVFEGGAEEPLPIVDVRHSILGDLSKTKYRVARLYFVLRNASDVQLVDELRDSVKDWDHS